MISRRLRRARADANMEAIDSMNEPSGERRHGIVIGTSGHIDHGKTALVRALTGTDTDRLPEEKRRGISIELGFAYLDLPTGQRISFVDVPGHERFIRNMLAGVAGVDAVILIVAADEGVKPQTREHLDICRLLAINCGMIVVTKRDLVSDDQLARTCADIAQLVRGTFLEAAPLITVSSITGDGLSEVKHHLRRLAERVEPRPHSGVARLPVDRAFAMKGFGTVVTGTLWSGCIRSGDKLLVQPGAREVRVRGLQVHGAAIAQAVGGQRTAVNLSGIDHAEIHRGMVLMGASEITPVQALQVSLEFLPGTDVPPRKMPVVFHVATSEVPATVKILGAAERNRHWARVQLAEPALVVPGDRLVLRRPSPAQTIAGGIVIDAFPPARLQRAKTIARLEKLARSSVTERIEILAAESPDGRTVSDLVRRTGRTAGEVLATVRNDTKLVFAEAAQRVISKEWIETQQVRLVKWLANFHAQHPSAPGAPVSAARQDISPELMAAVLHQYAPVRVQGDVISLVAHRPKVSNEDVRSLQKLELAFRQAGFQPPAPATVLGGNQVDQKKARELLESLIKAQRLVRVSDDLIFHADVIGHIRTSLAAHKGRRFSVPEFKEWTSISRKYAIPLLEYLDRQRITRRDGDSRIVL